MSLLLFTLLLGAFQGLLLYRAKITLNHAITEAAREGAVTHAQSDPMTAVMAEQLSPLYGGWGTDGAEGLAKAVVKAKVDLALPLGRDFDAGSGYELQILSPTVEAFKDFGEVVDGKKEIPNHHLRFRDRAIGKTSKVNIQDANLLKIRATYGYKLTVPIAGDIIAAIMKTADPDRKHYYEADPPRLPITSIAVGRMQTAARVDSAQLSIKTALKPAGSGTVPPKDFTEEEAEELEEEITNPTDPENPEPEEPKPEEPKPEEEIECSTTWEDERYNVDSDLAWYNPKKWLGALEVVKNVVLDFATGLFQGVGDQATDLWNIINDLSVLTDIAEAFMENPRAVLEGMIEGVVDDVEKVMNCGPSDIGRIVGQNLNPAVILKIVGKLAKLTSNTQLSKYFDELDNKIKCTASTSFLAGTWVQTPMGLRPIESIQEGNLLLSRPESDFSAPNQSDAVTALHSRIAPNYHQLNTSIGTINATSEHPFWVIDKGWISAKDLKANDRLATINGEALLYDNGFQDESARVYNFTVDQSHTYFVAADGDSADALWVHNATCWDAGKFDLGQPIGHSNGRRIYEIVDEAGVKRRVYEGEDGRLYDIEEHPMDTFDTDVYKVDRADGTIDYQSDYHDYVNRKLADGEDFRSPEDYVAAREHWRKGNAAHQADVDAKVKEIKDANPEATVFTDDHVGNPDLSPDTCDYCKPDIIVVETLPNGELKVTVYEVKTGEAGLTNNQEVIYPKIMDGSALVSNKMANDIDGIEEGMTFAEAFKGGGYEKIKELRGPSYTER